MVYVVIWFLAWSCRRLLWNYKNGIPRNYALYLLHRKWVQLQDNMNLLTIRCASSWWNCYLWCSYVHSSSSA